jgi:hypothetical protein
MDPIEKGKLIDEIYFSMQTKYNETRIKRTFNEYGIESIPSKTYSEEELKELLWKSDAEVVIKIAKSLDLVITVNTKKNSVNGNNKVQKLESVFISHAEEDAEIVSDFIQILQAIGISSDIIFCSSLEEYGTPLGVNRLEDAKERLNEEALVFFMVSEHFYNSKICLIEMGNAWGQTKDHISVAIPPFKLKQMEGVFQNYQGIRIQQHKQLDMLKKSIENKFELEPKDHAVWERTRDMALNSIRLKLPKN